MWFPSHSSLSSSSAVAACTPPPLSTIMTREKQRYELDDTGTCSTCDNIPGDSEITKCVICESSYHGADCNEAGANPICNKSFLKLFLQRSTKSNFAWTCDHCLTLKEHNEASTLSDNVRTLTDSVQTLANQFLQLQGEFNKLQEKMPEKENQPNPTVWNNKVRVEEMKSSLMVKPDNEGNPVDSKTVKKIVLDNGIPVNNIVVSSTGATFINLPNQNSRDKLGPLLQSDSNDIVMLKSKLPTISLLGVTDELTKEEIKTGICRQNDGIGKLVEDGQELTVIYTRPPPVNKSYHQVTIRVSPDIRSAIKSSGDKIHLSSKVCKVRDSFHVKRCNKCQSFGHYAAKCRVDTPDVCGYCGNGHKSSECSIKDESSNSHSCCNCAIAGMKSDGHSTFSLKCPTYIIQQDKLKSSIAYDYNLN